MDGGFSPVSFPRVPGSFPVPPSPRTMKNPVLLCILVGWLLPVSGLPAQTGGSWEVFQPLDLPNPDEGPGFSAVSIPDIDGDGIRELVIGSYLAEKPFLKGSLAYDSGSMDVYSGASGQLLHRFWGGPRFGYAAMLGMGLDDAGDVDGDGVPDLIGGAPMDLAGSGAAYVYSLSRAAPSKLLFRIDGENLTDHMGFAVAGLGDVDHDGFSEVASAGPMASAGSLAGAGMVRACSGPSGATLWERSGPAAGAMFGRALAGAGDLNGDGAGDLIVAVPGLAQVHLLDGTTGQLLRILPAPPGVGGFGASVAGKTDLNGDGVPDVLVGATAGPGAVLAFSGADGSLLFQIDGGPRDRMGFQVAFAGDVDGDGQPDVLAGAPKADRQGMQDNGAALLYSGADQHLLAEWSGPNDDAAFGFAVTSLGDWNKNGNDEIVATALGAGNAWILGFNPILTLSSESVSLSSGGSVLFRVEFPPEQSGMDYMLLLSLAGPGSTSVGSVEVPLQQDHLFDLSLNGHHPRGFHRASGVLDSQGRAGIGLVLPPGAYPKLGGKTLYSAVLALNGIQALQVSIARSLILLP